jgi:hypothetical protein
MFKKIKEVHLYSKSLSKQIKKGGVPQNQQQPIVTQPSPEQTEVLMTQMNQKNEIIQTLMTN